MNATHTPRLVREMLPLRILIGKLTGNFAFIGFAIATSGCATVSPKAANGHNTDPLSKGPGQWDECRFEREDYYAKTNAVYAIASFNVYEKNPHKITPLPFPKNEKWKPIDRCVKDEIGFGSHAYLRTLSSGARELVVAFRGTTDFCNDFRKGNLVFSRHISGYNQYDAALEFARRAQGKAFGVPMVLVGHSLGGGLAEYCQRQMPASRSVTFATSPNTGVLYSIGISKQPKKSLRLFERFEILNYFRWIGSPMWMVDYPRTKDEGALWINFQRGFAPLADHSIAVFAVDLVKLAALWKDPTMVDLLEIIRTTEPGSSGPRFEQACSPVKQKKGSRFDY